MESMRRARRRPVSSLQSALLGLADHRRTDGAGRTCPWSPGGAALHRSPVRAAVLAGLAAGASAAAASASGWPGSARPGPTRRPRQWAAGVDGDRPRPAGRRRARSGTRPPLGVVPAAAVLSVRRRTGASGGARRRSLAQRGAPRLAQSRHE